MGVLQPPPAYPPMHTMIRQLSLFALICSGFATAATTLGTEDSSPLKRWAFEYGVAFMTSNTIDEVVLMKSNIANGPAGGQIHLLTASYALAEPTLYLGDSAYKPLLELPLTLGIVDENGRSPFLNYSVSFQVRWRDFPWNHLIKTSMAMGVGLAYSEKIFLMDEINHADKYRSHVKFNWPIQLALSLPQYPEHQLTLFIMHQSGGCMFDRGGVNDVGFGYRYSL